MRDLIRVREVASKDVRQARQRIQGFLLRYGRRALSHLASKGTLTALSRFAKALESLNQAPVQR
jgi:hypothetical protein